MKNNSIKESVQEDYVLPEFHNPPKGYSYEQTEFKRNVIAIWILHQHRFDYNGGAPVRCIWGFHNTKTKEYHAPINSGKMGSVVSIEQTTPYSAMQLNLNPLMQCLMSLHQ